MIGTGVQKQNSSNLEDWAAREIDPSNAPRAMRKMLDRTDARFGVKPDWIAADTAYPRSLPLPIAWTVWRK